MSMLSKLELSVSDKEATPTLQLDENHEASVLEIELHGCDFFFPSSPSHPTIGIWKWFGKLVDLDIKSCDALIYWPEEEFLCLVSLKNLFIRECSRLIGPTPTQVKGDPTQPRDRLLPHLSFLSICDCERLTELFILPPSLSLIQIIDCPNVVSIWGKESESVQVEQLDLSCTSMLERLPSPRNNSLSCLEHLNIIHCGKLVALPYLPPSLKWIQIVSCGKLRSMSGQLDALQYLSIERCNMLESLECLGDLPSLQYLSLRRCKRLASLPAGYTGLRTIEIKYCPDLNMKPICECLKQGLDSLERKDLSHARSSDPREGPKLRDPKSWKYVIPRCRRY